MNRIVALPLLGLAGLLASCSDKAQDKGLPAATPAATGKPDAVPLAELDPASRLDLDSGRVSVFSPQGWRRAPRSYDYLVRYQSTPQLPYPAVVVLAADPPEGLSEVTADNHASFVEAIAAQLAAGDGTAIIRKPAGAKLGSHHAVSWAAGGEAKLDGTTKQIERDCTAVIVGGRLYTVEAWAPRGKLTDAGRAAGRAVAAALAIPTAEPLEPFATPAEPAAADPAPATEPAPAAIKAPVPEA